MTEAKTKAVKLLFRFYSEVLDQEAVETLWAQTVDPEMGTFRIDSIPFYVPDLATEDIVIASFDADEEMLTYIETIQHSGNSTIWVVIMDDDTNIENLQEIFYELDCDSEAMSERYFAMEIKANVDYLRIRDQLIQFKSAGILDYAEPFISEKHQY